MERPSLYRDIHKAIRKMTAALVERAGTTDFADPAAVAALRSATIDTFVLLESHAEHEDRFISPLVARHAPAVAAELGLAHVDQHEQVRALITLLLEEERGHASPWTRGQRFQVALSRFFGEMLVHMADEEEKAMTALWEHLSDAEIHAAHGAILASIEPSEMMASLRWMLPAMRPRDRVQLVLGARAAMPPPAFDALLALAAEVLAPSEADALARSITVAAAA